MTKYGWVQQCEDSWNTVPGNVCFLINCELLESGGRGRQSWVVTGRVKGRGGGKVVCTFLESQRRGEARLCVSRLSPSEFITSNSRPTVCNSNPAQLASISILLREVLSSFWGSWDAPFLVVLVTHWPQGWIPAFRKRVLFSLQHWTSHSSQSPFISAKAWSEKQYF